MEIHELNIFSGNLDANTYVAVDDTNDTGKLTYPQFVAPVKEYTDEEVAALKAEKDAELTDLQSELNELRYPNNYFTNEGVTSGKYINPSNGNYGNDGSYSVSDYLPINPNTVYSFPVYTSLFGSTQAKIQNFYTSDNTRVTASGVITDGIIKVTSPSNATQLRVTVKNSDLNSFMIVNGESYPTKHIEYGEVLLKDNVVLKNISKDDVNFIANADSFINLYDSNDADIEYGKTINYSGTLSTVADFNVSGFIPVIPNMYYLFPVYTSYFGTGDFAKRVPTYNANKEYLSNTLGTLITPSLLLIHMSANPTASYFRVNIAAGNAKQNYLSSEYHTNSNFMVLISDAEPSGMPNKYIPFDAIDVLSQEIHVASESVMNPLYRKKAVFIGDSICEGDDESGWAGRIGEKNKMLWMNRGVSGATFTSGLGVTAITTRNLLMSSPDYIIFEGGTNDADHIGSIIGGSVPEAFGTFSATDFGTNDEETYFGFDVFTFCGSLDYLCKKLIVNYAGAKIGYIVAQKMGIANDYSPEANNRRAYFEQAMRTCKKWGITFINLWDGCYLNPKIPTLYTADDDASFYKDGQHLKAKGYDYITPIIEAWMKML